MFAKYFLDEEDGITFLTDDDFHRGSQMTQGTHNHGNF